MRDEMIERELIEQTLNELLVKCNDAKEGFIKAAGLVDDPELKDFLMDRARRRIVFASDMENEILAVGANVNSSTSIISSLHRVWMEIQSTFSSDARAILSECLRGEYSSLEDYSKASIVEGLPGTTRAMILRQKESIRKSIGELKRWYAVVDEAVTA